MDLALLLESVRWDHLLVLGAAVVAFAIVHWLVLKPWKKQFDLNSEKNFALTKFLMLDSRLQGLTSEFVLKAADDADSGHLLPSKLAEIRAMVEKFASHQHMHDALLGFIACSEAFLKVRMAHASLSPVQVELNALMLAYKSLCFERSAVFELMHSN